MIACVYCGGRHASPAEVKQCWADHDGGSDGVAPDRQPAVQRVLVEPDRPPEPVASTTEPTPAPRPSDAVAVAGRGPARLGRNVVVGVDQEAPGRWAGCPRVVVDATVLRDPSAVISDLRTAANGRVSVVIELARDLPAPDTVERRPHHELGPGFTFQLDDLHHLVWSNSVDARSGGARFVPIERAVAAGAALLGDDSGDVGVPGVGPVWIDAGPVRHTDPVAGVPVLHAVQLEHRSLAVPAPNQTTAALAPDQLAAVTHPEGSARIIAPAGSGKTRVLTERARHLLRVWKIPAPALGLVAFNKRAQEEIRARTSDLPGLDIRTLNSIALAVINGVRPFAPQRQQWRTIDEPDVRRLLQRFVQSPKKLNVDPMAPWIDALSLVRLGLVDPFEVEGRYGGDVDGLSEVWPMYRDALERQGVVDFDDQIRRAIEVLLTQPEARRAAQRACRVLLVDEFQDLTPAHLLLIRLLAGPGGGVFGVGDDDQTIYGYNGADPGWLIDFEHWFPGSGDHPLGVNYRCPAGLVDVADRLLRHNRRRVAKTIRPAPGRVDLGPGWSVDDGDDPVAGTVAAVRQALAVGAASDVAVLTRVNATIAPVQVALGVAGIGYNGGVGSEYVERTSVRAALAWLRLASGAEFQAADIGEALRRPSRSLRPKIRDWVAEQRTPEGLLRLADRVTNDKDATRIREFAGDIARLQAIINSGATTARVFTALIDEIGLGGAVSTLDVNRHGMNRASQSDDLLALRQIARLQPDPSAFEGFLRQALLTRRDPDGVTLATVHRVKGQEWPHVIVHLVSNDQFPHRLSEDREEERRLFHVAITRASSHVTVVTGDHPSEFVAELTDEPPPPGSIVSFPTAPTRAAAVAKPAPRREPSDHPLLDRERVMAVVGLGLVDQGQTWTITELEPAAAVAVRNATTRKFALGQKVETTGRQRGILRPRSGDVEEASVRLFDLLRAYRDSVRDGKPAYTVFDDKTLAAIATAIPADLAALAGVKGVGPAKLEQYGDDVLELVVAATDPGPA